MRKIFAFSSAMFISFGLHAGCMTNKVNAINDKLKVSAVSETVKQEVMRLRDLGIKNEHSNAKMAVKYFEDAIGKLN